jgi:hypothetical protein
VTLRARGTALRYRVRMHWATTLTALGALLGGLALPIAFLQLGAQRRDRQRAQVGKIGAWAECARPGTGRRDEPRADWLMRLLIRNSSELPVTVHQATMNIQALGYNRVAPKLTKFPKTFSSGSFGGRTGTLTFAPGTIAPGQTWTDTALYCEAADAAPPKADPRALITSVAWVVLTDAAGCRWEIAPEKTGPPRRVRQGLHWRWMRRRHATTTESPERRRRRDTSDG